SFPACGAGVVLLDQQPIGYPIADCRLKTLSISICNLQFYSVIPDGLEPSLPGCRPGVVAAGPRDRRCVRKRGQTPLSQGVRPLDRAVAEVGIEPTDFHQALDLAALPICVLGYVMLCPKRGQTPCKFKGFSPLLEFRSFLWEGV